MVALVTEQTFPAALAERIIRALARKQLGLFQSFPEYDLDYIASEGMFGAMRQWSQYDPTQSQPQTFIQQRAATAIIDLHRRAKAGKNKLKRLYRVTTDADMQHEDEAPDEAESDTIEQPLAEWLVEVQANARKTFGVKRYRRGRKFYAMPQLIALAALMKKYDLSARACVRMLAEREDLRISLKLRRVPSHDSLTRAMHALEAFHETHFAPPDSDATSPDDASGDDNEI